MPNLFFTEFLVARSTDLGTKTGAGRRIVQAWRFPRGVDGSEKKDAGLSACVFRGLME